MPYVRRTIHSRDRVSVDPLSNMFNLMVALDARQRFHHLWLVLTSVVLAVSTAVAVGEQLKRPRKVKVEAGVQGTFEEARSYLKANGRIVEKIVPESCRKCAVDAPADAMVDFEVVVVVGKGGKPVKVSSVPTTDFTACVSRALEVVTFTEPPREPLEVYFDVSFDRPGGRSSGHLSPS